MESGGRGLHVVQVLHTLEAASFLTMQISNKEISSSIYLITLAIWGHHVGCRDLGHPMIVLQWGSGQSLTHHEVHSRCQQHLDGPHGAAPVQWQQDVSQKYNGVEEKLSELWVILVGSGPTWADLLGRRVGGVGRAVGRNQVGKA